MEIMNIKLNPKLLDVVEVPNRLLGYETPGAALGTVVEVFEGPPQQLLVEVCDETGVPSDLVTIPVSEVRTAWPAAEHAQETSSPVDAKGHFEKGIFLLQNGLIVEAKSDLKAAFELDPGLGKISIGATFTHTGEHRFSYDTDLPFAQGAIPYNPAILPATNLLNLNLNWKDVGGSPVDLAIFATNVTQQKYHVAVTNALSSSGAEFLVLGEPRMFGGRIKVRFGN